MSKKRKQQLRFKWYRRKQENAKLLEFPIYDELKETVEACNWLYDFKSYLGMRLYVQQIKELKQQL